MSQRRSEKEEFWRLVLVEFSNGGLKVREFCRQEGISEPSFYAWRKKIAGLDEQQRSAVPDWGVPDWGVPDWVPVMVVTDQGAATGSENDLANPQRELNRDSNGQLTPSAGSPRNLSAPSALHSELEVTTLAGLKVRIGDACSLELIQRTLLALDPTSHRGVSPC